jgi:hypothetical protein
MNNLIELIAHSDAPVTERLESLLRDAASTFNQLSDFGQLGAAAPFYPMRHFWICMHPRHRETEADRYFVRVINAIEVPGTIDVNIAGLAQLAGGKRRAMPTPAMARRLRIVTEEIPQLLRPIASYGIGSNTYALWHLLWHDATGVTAPKIAKAFAVKRNQVWKLRKRAYEALAAELEPLLKQRAA